MSTLYDMSTDFLRRIYDSRISDPPVLDWVSRFPEASRYIEAWPVFRDEAQRLMENIAQVPRFHELMAQQAYISADDNRDWRMFVLKAYGTPIPRNMAQCPELAALVESIPDVLTATLSFLAPHKHIPLHRGPFRGVLRFYLGLSVPADSNGRPGTVLAIDGTEYRIADGECLLWDDTFPHEVWNHSESYRIALLLDVRRHGMPLDMELLSRLIIKAVGIAVRIHRPS
jgi:aspartate beta-hydroxylase